MGITLKDIAERAGVSQMTVSRVLSEKATGQVSKQLQDRILEIARDFNYSPRGTSQKLAKILDKPSKSGRRPPIVMLIPCPGFLDNPLQWNLHNQIVFGGIMEAVTAAEGSIEVIPVSASNEPMTIRWPWLEGIGAGARVIATGPWFIIPLLELSERHCRIAMIQNDGFWRSRFAQMTKSWALFTYQNRQGTELQTKQLIDAGHRRIALLMPENAVGEPENALSHGYEAALQEAGISYRQVIAAPSGKERESVAKAYAEKRFDALIAHIRGDSSSAGEWNYPQSFQLNCGIPESVDVVLAYEWCNSRLFDPDLPAMSYPLREMAVDAVNALLADEFQPGERLYPGRFSG